jgi:hypothetical protein
LLLLWATAVPTRCSFVLGSYCSNVALVLLVGPVGRTGAGAKSFAGGELGDHHGPMGTAAEQQAGSGTPSPAVPAAQGVRLAWEQVPLRLRQRIEQHLGSRVTRAVTQLGGFSPGAAARLEFADGRRAFVKAVSPEQNPDSPGIYLAEAEITACLPAAAVVAGVAGYFTDRSRQPAPKGIPTVREFQRALAETTLRWLRERIELASEV